MCVCVCVCVCERVFFLCMYLPVKTKYIVCSISAKIEPLSSLVCYSGANLSDFLFSTQRNSNYFHLLLFV